MSLAAVNPRTNATVFASAGTGKTWLLVARLARLLLAGATPGSILAVTFTKKAAGEMQERLMERLEHWAVCDDLELQASLQEIGADTESSTVTRARCLYEELLATGHPVRLTTFHAFCNELLSQFPLEANIPPGYELIENTQELQDEAWEMLMRETREDTHPDLYATMKQLLQGVGSMSNMQTALEAFFNQRSDWWAYTEGHDAPLRWALEQLPGLFDCDPDDDPYEGICHPRWLDHFEEYARLLQADKANKTMKTNGAAIKAALDGKAPPQVLIEAVITAAKTNKGEPRKTSASKAYQKANGAEDSEALERLHAEINGRLDDFIEHNNRLANLQLNGVWYQAGTRYLEHYQNLKLQQRQLDFADMEWQAYRLLNRSDDASWVQYKLDQRIDHLLIDEFQDTNPTQWRLLKPLLEEFAGGDPERQRSAFLVGDTKQSIYSFRRANPRLQDTAAEWLKTHLNSKASGMDKSRRSSAAIMQAVNAVFSASPFDSQIPRFTPHDTYLGQLWGRVELYPAFALPKPEEPACDPGLRDPITTPRAEKPSVKALEADFIARRITALIEDKTPIGPAGEARPVTYGNITILLRTRNAAPEIERALRSHNIPYQGTARGKFLPRLEITDIRALLKVLHSPQDNLALAQVLKSPIFDFSDEDLVKLAVGLKHPIDPASPKPMHWFDVLQGLAGEDGAATHFRDAITLLEGWRHDYANLPLHDLLEKIYFEGDVLARYHAASPSWQQNQVRANLKRLVEIALELDSGRYPSLNRFLGRLDDLENSSAAPSEPQPDHANAPVQILTIHESKGLEAPVIFYADLAAQGQQDKAWGAIVEWPPEAERPEAILLQAKKEQLDSISRRYIEHREQRQYEEAGNLTYVALTRARQILILSASRGSKESKPYDQLFDAIKPLCKKQDNPTFPDMLAFESGERPAIVEPANTNLETSETPPPPPELSQPFNIEPGYREILPSQQDDASSRNYRKLRSNTENTAEGQESAEEARLRGNAIHACLEKLTQLPTTNSAQSIPFEQQVQSLRYRLAADLNLEPDDPRLDTWLQESRRVIEQHPELFVLDASQRAFNEQPILYRQQKQTVYGIIDRLIVGEDQVLIIDYKTHRIRDHAEAEIVAADYSGQMRAYATGVQKLWPEKSVSTELLFTAIGQRIKLDLNP